MIRKEGFSMSEKRVSKQDFMLDGECFSNEIFYYSFIQKKAPVLLSNNKNIIKLRCLLKERDSSSWFSELVFLGVLIRRNNNIRTMKYSKWKALGSDGRDARMNSISVSIRKLRSDLSEDDGIYIPSAYRFFECGDAFVKNFMGGVDGLGKSRRLENFCRKKGYKSFFDDSVVEVLDKLLAYVEVNGCVKERGGGKFAERMFVLKVWKFFEESINIKKTNIDTLIPIILYLVHDNYKKKTVKTSDIKRWIK
jgi:hypothetical protein